LGCIRNSKAYITGAPILLNFDRPFSKLWHTLCQSSRLAITLMLHHLPGISLKACTCIRIWQRVWEQVVRRLWRIKVVVTGQLAPEDSDTACCANVTSCGGDKYEEGAMESAWVVIRAAGGRHRIQLHIHLPHGMGFMESQLKVHSPHRQRNRRNLNSWYTGSETCLVCQQRPLGYHWRA
jgi:hypothetical protein